MSLRAAQSELVPLRNFLADTPDDYTLSGAEASNLMRVTSDLRRTLEAEAGGTVAYILRDKRYDVTKLLTDVSDLLDERVYGWLPDIARYDFSEAGRCIAMETPTAAAFHLLRGTESASVSSTSP